MALIYFSSKIGGPTKFSFIKEGHEKDKKVFEFLPHSPLRYIMNDPLPY